jgi:hypothetical protein
MTTEYEHPSDKELTYEELEKLLSDALSAVGALHEQVGCPGYSITLDQIESLQTYTSNMNEVMEDILNRVKDPQGWEG